MDEHLLEGLFRWSHSFTIKDSLEEDFLNTEGEPVTVYQRIVGDAEVDLARQTALRSSALKRRQLIDPDSLDRLTLIPDYSLLAKDDLIGLILLNELAELRTQASRELTFSFPELPPSNSSLEEQEEYQTAVDTFFDRREKALQEKITELVDVRRRELGKLRKNRLHKIHEDSTINVICREEMLATFNEMIAYLGTYSDSDFTKKSFSTYYSFKNSASNLKRQLIEKYAELEISGNDLKK